jgi:hypothetical protein
LLELHADVSRVADALEKLVFLLEKLVFPPQPPEIKVQQATLDDLKTVSEDDIIRMREEQTEFARRYQVMPNSPAFAQALFDWEAQMRGVYGERWEPPQDWRTIISQAASRAGGGGEQTDAPAQAAQSR